MRPVRLLAGVRSPLRDRAPADIDFVIVRENNEGEYSSIGGRIYAGTDDEIAMQESVFTRRGVDKILRFAFELAKTRPKRHLTSATKSNGITITLPFWDERFKAVATGYPEIRTDQYHIDILTAHFVQHPDWFDVVVGSNLFGDILSDLGPAIAGTIGIAPSANLNPEREYPSMFEPVHGSAPDIAGKGIANPIGQIWSGAMMLEHLGQPEAAASVMAAIEKVLVQGPRTARYGRPGIDPRGGRSYCRCRLEARRPPLRRHLARERPAGRRRVHRGLLFHDLPVIELDHAIGEVEIVVVVGDDEDGLVAGLQFREKRV